MHALPGDRESTHTVLQSHSCPIFILSKTNLLSNARSGATAYFMYSEQHFHGHLKIILAGYQGVPVLEIIDLRQSAII